MEIRDTYFPNFPENIRYMGDIRIRIERRERQTLSSYATFSDATRGRRLPENEDDVRPAFQHDRDRIIHSKSFRRLKYKTQVFLAPAGDHYRTRLTHTIEVSQIARTITRSLFLNEDLAEAIALGHDLGHTPFGHAGEEVLNRCKSGGFEHAAQSLRVVDLLERDGRGLNLTMEVRDGIRRHSKGRGKLIDIKSEKLPKTPEGRIVRLADVIAYTNHDLDDALRAGILAQKDVPKNILSTLGKTHSKRIDTMIRDVIANSAHGEGVVITGSEEIWEAVSALRDFLFERVYYSPAVKPDFEKSKAIVETLFTQFKSNPLQLENEMRRPPRFSPEREAADFVAGMTDRYAIQLYSRLYLPSPWMMETPFP